MRVVEASAVVPLSPEETWDFFFGDQLRGLVEAVDNVVAVENYQMRADGTPRYQMVRKVGPLTMRSTSDYSVYERPYRSVSRALGGPFGGTFYTEHEPLAGGEATRLSFRMEVEPQNLLARVMLPVVVPMFRRQLQQDADDVARAAAPQGIQPRQNQQQRPQVAASGARLARTLGWVSIGVGLVAIVAPVPAISAFGMGERPKLGRLLGARDIVLGAGMLGGQNTAGWVRARGVADALDGALLLGGAAKGAFRRDRALMSVVVAAGFSALSFWLARRLEG